MDNPIRLHWLDPRNPHQHFPPVHLAMRDPDGLLAIGGDLSQVRLLRAYAQGIFPWYNPDEPILFIECSCIYKNNCSYIGDLI